MRRAIVPFALVMVAGGCADLLGLGAYGFGGAGGTGGVGGSVGGSGGAGAGGGGAGGGGSMDPCLVEPKPLNLISSDFTSDATLSCAFEHLLTGTINVQAGATLTIEPGALVTGNLQTALVVRRGARILADGTEDRPIVFRPSGASPGPGAWGGLIVEGDAPGDGSSNCIDHAFFGVEDDDDSGVIRYVRIEYAGTDAVDCNAGLTLVGVGRKTLVDFVEVVSSADDCFLLKGGTVDLRHIVCLRARDDLIDAEKAYQGRVQFAVHIGVKTPVTDQGAGLETNDPGTSIHARNVTFCGYENPLPQHTGLNPYPNTSLVVERAIVKGYASGLDATEGMPGDSYSGVLVRNSVFDDLEDIGQAESGATDDDGGFDEGVFGTGFGNTQTAIPLECWTSPFVLVPADPAGLGDIGAFAPDDFFVAAEYMGAAPSADDWLSKSWLVY